MSFDFGVNFRSTSGYVTDPSNTTYCSNDAYPTTRGGQTFGWVSLTASVRNRDSAIDARIAGVNFVSATTYDAGRFRIDLPETGNVSVHLACGDATSTNSYLCILYDNTTSKGTLVAAVTAGQDNFRDATDTNYSDTAWPGSETAEVHNFATTTAFFEITPTGGSGNHAIAHIRVHIDLTRTQKSFAFYEDGTESAATIIGSIDTAITRNKADPFQLRVGMQTNGDAASEKATLYYKETSDADTEYRAVPN